MKKEAKGAKLPVNNLGKSLTPLNIPENSGEDIMPMFSPRNTETKSIDLVESSTNGSKDFDQKGFWTEDEDIKDPLESTSNAGHARHNTAIKLPYFSVKPVYRISKQYIDKELMERFKSSEGVLSGLKKSISNKIQHISLSDTVPDFQDDLMNYLYRAVGCGRLDLVKLALEKCNADSKSIFLKQHYKIFSKAFKPNDINAELLDFLVEFFAQSPSIDESTRGNLLNSILNILSENENYNKLLMHGVDVISLLSKAIKNIENIDHADSEGKTPLNYAKGLGSHEVVKWLLDNKADPLNSLDKEGNTISHYAFMSKNFLYSVRVIEKLYELSALDTLNNNLETPFMKLVKSLSEADLGFESKQSIHSILYMILLGVDYSNRKDIEGKTALDYCIESKLEPILSIMAGFKNNNPALQDIKVSKTLVNFICKYTDEAALTELIEERGLNVNLIDIEGISLLANVITFNKSGLLKVLLDHDVEVNNVEYNEHHPLYILASRSGPRIAAIFCDNVDTELLKAMIDQLNPIKLAITKENYETAKMLADHSSNPEMYFPMSSETLVEVGEKIHKSDLNSDSAQVHNLLGEAGLIDGPEVRGDDCCCNLL